MDREFWDQHHTTSNSTWLTGSMVNAYLEFFNLSRDFLSDKSVLEIGVGLGRASRELVKCSKQFYCSDISQVALDKLSDVVEHRFLTGDLSKIPPVDVAICFLVTVHCPDREVIRILNDINLTAQGQILVQFSGPHEDGVISDRARETFVDNGSHVFRTTSDIQQLVDRTNKRIQQFLPPRTVHHDGWFTHDWHPVIITNQ